MLLTHKEIRRRPLTRKKKLRSLLEIEEHIRPLSRTEKITLLQDIAAMLQDDDDHQLLERLQMAVVTTDPRYAGPLEAYEAASQLQALLEQEHV